MDYLDWQRWCNYSSINVFKRIFTIKSPRNFLNRIAFACWTSGISWIQQKREYWYICWFNDLYCYVYRRKVWYIICKCAPSRYDEEEFSNIYYVSRTKNFIGEVNLNISLICTNNHSPEFIVMFQLNLHILHSIKFFKILYFLPNNFFICIILQNFWQLPLSSCAIIEKRY